ncbi:MAG: hypothetical protein F6K35_48245 [Okeania sp. SIO2H7]|nr:hypothetical protein [Okeania sp. SIO2H7]
MSTSLRGGVDKNRFIGFLVMSPPWQSRFRRQEARGKRQKGKRLTRFTAASLRTSGSFLRGGSEFFLGERSLFSSVYDIIKKWTFI